MGTETKQSMNHTYENRVVRIEGVPTPYTLPYTLSPSPK